MPALEKEKMSVLEKKLIGAAFRGDWVGPDKLPVLSRPFGQEEIDITVRGTFLRELLLGLRVPGGDAEQDSRLHGVRLRGAIIKGEIDLSDCKGVGGAPLPPLLLEHCIISDVEYSTAHDEAAENKDALVAINASNTRLSRLSLNGCRVAGRVDLTHATLDGDLEISDVAPLDERSCQLFAPRCRIDGSVIAMRTHLRIPDGHHTEFGTSDYALNVAGAEIHGSIMLQPDFYAQGGVSVRGTRVNGDIWAEAATFRASNEIAFRAESLQCGGAVALHGSEDKEGRGEKGQHCKVQGKLDFLDATIGFLDLRGIHIKRLQNLKEPADQALLNLYLVRVRDNFWLGNLLPTLKTIVESPIRASAMTVGGDLDLTSLKLGLPSGWSDFGIVASNLHVGGDLILDDLTTSIDLTSSHVERNLSTKGAIMRSPDNRRYGLLARNITIGNDCTLENVSGTVDLELARIGGELKVFAQDLAALNAKDAEVRGSVSVSGIFIPQMKEHRLRFDGGSYRSGFSLGDRKSPNCALNSLGFITARSSLIPGIGNISNQYDELIPTLSIEGAWITNDFWVTEVWATEAPRYSFIEACGAPLSFYPDWMLVEALFQLEGDRKAIVAFLKHQLDMTIEPIPLAGQSTPIHQLNKRGMLNLDSTQTVRDYLKFFCAYVWGEEGSFLVIETEKALRGAKLSAPVEFADVSVKEDKEKGWICVAMIRYADKLYRSELHVSPDGNVEMTKDEFLADIEREEHPVRFEPPLRILTSECEADTAVSPFWIPLILSAAQVEKITIEEIVQDVEPVLQRWVQLGIQANKAKAVTAPGRAVISLRGLKTRVFHHDPEKSWQSGIKLRLDGFEYERVETVALREVQDKAEGEAEIVKGEVKTKAEFNKTVTQKTETQRTRSYKPIDATVDAHIDWLSRQYGCPLMEHHEQKGEGACGRLIACAVEAEKMARAQNHRNIYEPQPYEQLARALRNDGKYEEAKHITLVKLSLERRFVHREWLRPFLYVTEKWFNYGLFPGKSVIWFLVWLLVGTGAFYIGNYQLDKPVLVRQSVAGSPALPEQRCGKEVDSFWYALDAFVPGLDLKQEDKCSITTRDEAWLWRAFSVLYEIWGAIVTSIMLLSVSGLLRRYVEK